MVRLYKALHANGVTMEIIPSKDMYEVEVIFRYKGVFHRTWYNLDRLDEDTVIKDLYSIIRYIDCLEGDFVCC